MSTAHVGVLQVYKKGTLTVVGFGGQDVLDTVNITEFRDELTALIEDAGCETLAIDLTGVKLIPSGLLGLLASLRRKNIDVLIYNPSDDIRDVLEVTKLNQVMKVYDIEI